MLMQKGSRGCQMMATSRRSALIGPAAATPGRPAIACHDVDDDDDEDVDDADDVELDDDDGGWPAGGANVADCCMLV